MATISWAAVDHPENATGWSIEFIANGQVLAEDTGGLDAILTLSVPDGSVGHFEGTSFNALDQQVVRRPSSGTVTLSGDSGPHTFFFELGSLSGGGGNGPEPPSGGNGGSELPFGLTQRQALIFGGAAIVALAGLAIFMQKG